VLALRAQRQELHREAREDPMIALLRLRPLAAMITVVRTQVCADGTCLRCSIRVLAVQLDDGKPVEICDACTLLPCAADLTEVERAEVLHELACDLRARRERDPHRYATRHVPEAA
jgi:hypothetical protein